MQGAFPYSFGKIPDALQKNDRLRAVSGSVAPVYLSRRSGAKADDRRTGWITNQDWNGAGKAAP
jgi:hypothetical protein